MLNRSPRASAGAAIIGTISVGRVLALIVATLALFVGVHRVFGQAAASVVAVVAGVVGGLALYHFRPVPAVAVSAPATARGCRFIPLDAEDITSSLLEVKREAAPPGAVPPVLAGALSAPPSPPSRAAQPRAGALRLSGQAGSSGRSPLPAAAPVPVAVPVDAVAAPAAFRRASSQEIAARAVPATEEPAPAEDSKVCPKCGADLVPRLNMDGPMAGKLLWRCRQHPACDFVRSPTRDAQPALRLKS